MSWPRHLYPGQRFTAVLLLPLAASGCLLVPGVERSSVQPMVEGVIEYSGEPMRDRQVFVRFATRRLDCASSINSTRTDVNGRFAITPHFEGRKYRMMTLAPSSPTYFITVCLADSIDQNPLFVQSYYGAPPPVISLQCAIDKSAVEIAQCSVATPQTSQGLQRNSGLIRQGSYLQ